MKDKKEVVEITAEDFGLEEYESEFKITDPSENETTYSYIMKRYKQNFKLRSFLQ